MGEGSLYWTELSNVVRATDRSMLGWCGRPSTRQETRRGNKKRKDMNPELVGRSGIRPMAGTHLASTSALTAAVAYRYSAIDPIGAIFTGWACEEEAWSTTDFFDRRILISLDAVSG